MERTELEKAPRAPDLDRVARSFRRSRREFRSSPLYERLSGYVAGEEDLLRLAAGCAPGQQIPNLVFGAVHFLILQHPEEPLAAFYPSSPGFRAGAPADAPPAFHAFCLRRHQELRKLLRTRLVQTNVVKRSIALRLALAGIAGRAPRISLLEIGAGAGLNLCFDDYSIELGDRRFGPASADLHLTSHWGTHAPVPDLDALPEVSARLGVDLRPIDLSSDEDRRWMRALVWPEERAKAELLEQAIAAGLKRRPVVLPGDAAGGLQWIARRLSDGPLVVFHSAVRAHVPAARRAAFDAAIFDLGRERTVYHVSLEGRGMLHDHPAWPAGQIGHALGVTTVEGGAPVASDVLAAVDGHAEWIHWFEDAR